MKFGLRIPSFALGPKTATLAEMGAYLRRAEDLGAAFLGHGRHGHGRLGQDPAIHG